MRLSRSLVNHVKNHGLLLPNPSGCPDNEIIATFESRSDFCGFHVDTSNIKVFHQYTMQLAERNVYMRSCDSGGAKMTTKSCIPSNKSHSSYLGNGQLYFSNIVTNYFCHPPIILSNLKIS